MQSVGALNPVAEGAPFNAALRSHSHRACGLGPGLEDGNKPSAVVAEMTT